MGDFATELMSAAQAADLDDAVLDDAVLDDAVLDDAVLDDAGLDDLALQRCSIAGALNALGDSWSVMVLRELFFGVHRFNDIQRDLAISRSVLTERLGHLVDLGIVRTRPYQNPGERSRNEYRLTRKGVDLLAVMVALMEWGDTHVNAGEPPVVLFDKVTGEPVRVELRSAGGRLVQPNETEPRSRG